MLQGRREAAVHHRGLHGVRADVPLALTSTTGWIRRLGGKRWQLLHRLVYLQRNRGRDPLLLAGEERHPAAADVRSLCGCVAGYRVLVSVFKHKAPATVKRPASISPFDCATIL